MSIHENSDVRVPINSDSLSIQREENKCILCGNCRSVCKYSQGVYGKYDLKETGDYAICIDCGQCSNVCPTGSICEVKDYLELKKLMKNSEYTFVFETAPSVRVALGEEFCMPTGSFVEGQMVSALRKLGAHYVLDTVTGADLTVMEEANELLERIENEENLPMFTSCCPAWVKFVETFYPEFIPNLSTCKSPILMEGALVKTYFSTQLHLDAEKIKHVAVTPCTAKKAEIKKEGMNVSSTESSNFRDVDFVITTRELAEWIREEKIDFLSLEESKYDSLLGESTGAGLIFGATGGVMEATIRTASFYITGEKLEQIEFENLRGFDGIKEAKVMLGDIELSVAVVTGTNNAHKFLELLKKGEKHYDFIEVMACVGGCIAGGGQPKVKEPMSFLETEKRGASLYAKDRTLEKRCSYENSEIQKLYNTYLRKPGSPLAKKLLHTTYTSKKDLLHKSVKVNN